MLISFLGTLVKVRKVTIGFVVSVCPCIRPSVRPCWTTRLLLVGFSWNLLLEHFSKICRLNSSLIKTGQKWILYMNTSMHYWSHLAQFFLEWKMFRTKVVEKIKTHTLCSITFFFRRSWFSWDSMEKYCRARRATDDSMAHGHCILNTKGYKHTRRICSTYCFSLQKWLHGATQCYVIVQCCHIFHACNMPRPSSQFGQHSSVQWRAHNLRLLFVQSSSHAPTFLLGR